MERKSEIRAGGEEMLQGGDTDMETGREYLWEEKDGGKGAGRYK
jgi:hypothetical protein